MQIISAPNADYFYPKWILFQPPMQFILAPNAVYFNPKLSWFQPRGAGAVQLNLGGSRNAGMMLRIRAIPWDTWGADWGWEQNVVFKKENPTCKAGSFDKEP